MALVSGHATGGYLQSEPSDETLLSSDTLTVNTGGLVVVGAESGTADDLATINIGANMTLSGYQLILFITATIGDTITIKHGTGNIVTNTGADVTLTENKVATLIRFVGTTTAKVNNKWKCIA